MDIDSLLMAEAEGRLIVTEYPCRPKPRLNAQSPACRSLVERLKADTPRYADLLRDIARHIPALLRIPAAETPGSPFWCNPWFPPFDGVSLYGLLAHRRPQRYIEVGSGMSTAFARQAIRDLGLDTRVISIDPYPRADIDAICDQVIRAPMESVGAEFWQSIRDGDMIFVDNSHLSFPGSDVTTFFSDVLPVLPAGTIWGLHDIFLPDDYPDFWMDRFYNEQYLLLAYLLGGGRRDEILLPLAWATEQADLHGILSPLWEHDALFAAIAPYRGIKTRGGAFWMRRH